MIQTSTNLQGILTAARASDEPIILYGVGWDVYQAMLDLIGEQRYPRLTYANGVLKIMGNASSTHENTSRFLYDLIRITSLVLRIKVIPAGSKLLKSNRRRKGAQPDESFYIQAAANFPNKKTLWSDGRDAPPDLVIEVDETSKSIEKFAIYADFGVKEFWLFDVGELAIYTLDEVGSFVQAAHSRALPILTTRILNDFLTRRHAGEQFEALLDFEEYLRNEIKNK